MTYTATAIGGVWIIEPQAIEDARGSFARTFSREDFLLRGLNAHIELCALSFNLQAGTLRGLHFQRKPHREDKLVRCTQGAIYDVVLDLRADSPTFETWLAVELSAANRRMIYVPGGCAHGFQTLQDGAEVSYQISEEYHPESASGIRFNSPRYNIAWPLEVTQISARDLALAEHCEDG